MSTDPRLLIRQLVNAIDCGTQTWHLQHSALMSDARAYLASTEDDDLQKDAERYRWLKKAPGLELRSEYASQPWQNVETGRKYYPSHFLAAYNTGFSGIEHLDDAIDQAMEMYP